MRQDYLSTFQLLSLILSGLLLLNPAVAEDAAVKNSLAGFLAGLKTFSADFEQVLLSEFNEPLEVSIGQVNLTRDGQFYWNYTAPYVQKIISNGETVWIYDEDLEQVTINSAIDAIQNTPVLIFSGAVELAEHYTIVETPFGDGLTMVELQPHDAEAQYQKVIFGFNDDVLLFMILHDALGHTTKMEFSHTERNLRIAQESFNFVIPEGVDVIDNRTSIPGS